MPRDKGNLEIFSLSKYKKTITLEFKIRILLTLKSNVPKVGEVLVQKSIFSFEKVAEGNLGQVLRWSCQVQFSLFSRQETFLFIFSSFASFHFIKTSMSLMHSIHFLVYRTNFQIKSYEILPILVFCHIEWLFEGFLSSLQRNAVSFLFLWELSRVIRKGSHFTQPDYDCCPVYCTCVLI